MRGSYLKNAAMLTASDVALRLAGMGLRIYLAGVLGGEGMGLYQLILAVYGLFVTLATAGVSVAATRLLAEELEKDPARARGMLRLLVLSAAGLGLLAALGQMALAGAADRYWLGDVRAAGALRAAAPGMPFMAVAAVLRGFFIARRKVEPNIASQLVEQLVRIGGMVTALEQSAGLDVGARCSVVMAATAASEAVSAGVMGLFYRREAARAFGGLPARKPVAPGRRIWEILWPVEGGRCLSSALHAAENMLVPACLAFFLQAAGGRSAAVTQYGNLKGMALPLLNFPFGLLGSLGVLLMPEITRTHIRGDRRRMEELLDRMLLITMYFSLWIGAIFWVWGKPLALAAYGSREAGFYLEVLAPAMPLLYLESMVDGAIKGIGEQKASFRYSVWDSVLRIAGVGLLIPFFGMKGLLFVILLSSLFTCLANTRRLLAVTGLPLRPARWLGGPMLAAGVSVLTGLWLRRGLDWALPGLLAGGRAAQLAALAAGGAGMSLAFLAAGWPLGLGRELKALRPARKNGAKSGTLSENSGQQEENRV